MAIVVDRTVAENGYFITAIIIAVISAIIGLVKIVGGLVKGAKRLWLWYEDSRAPQPPLGVVAAVPSLVFTVSSIKSAVDRLGDTNDRLGGTIDHFPTILSKAVTELDINAAKDANIIADAIKELGNTTTTNSKTIEVAINALAVEIRGLAPRISSSYTPSPATRPRSCSAPLSPPPPLFPSPRLLPLPLLPPPCLPALLSLTSNPLYSSKASITTPRARKK
ncbi:hypothetical protein K432DRAFT_462181 [Lepidopterella palustris CBS 459.81]|uniref:Uncharacterized protein n=1 Tax=Lepidopterella palustris CBS 459.81 TaxID=1314670 RepID=A0A8E2E3Q0_9PEZI|nr:hypothetical protein K432DRAFT_462181 [Lepidopterella palustris CBS 459.81]